MSKTTNDEKNKPDDQEPGKVIDPHFYALDFQLTNPLKIADPTDYVTRIYGKILLEENPADEQGGDDGDDSNHRFAALALRMDLTLYDLDRAQEEGQNPRDIFDCVSQGALEMYQRIYDGFELRPAIEAVIGEESIVERAVELSLPISTAGGQARVAAVQPFVAFVRSLKPQQAEELLAVMYLGRGDHSSFAAALKAVAGFSFDLNALAQQMAGKTPLTRYLRDGLAKWLAEQQP